MAYNDSTNAATIEVKRQLNIDVSDIVITKVHSEKSLARSMLFYSRTCRSKI